MRRILSTVLILALIACGALAEGDQQVAMRIVICEEQNFSTLCKPEYDYSYTPDGGLTLETADGPVKLEKGEIAVVKQHLDF